MGIEYFEEPFPALERQGFPVAHRLRTNKGFTSLMVPFFDSTVKVSVHDLGSDGAGQVD